MTGVMSSVKGFLAEFPMPILPNIDREPTREGLIDTNQLINGNVASMALNLVRGQYGHLMLTMMAK